MITVGIRELSQRTSELIRTVRDSGEKIVITYRGKSVAILVPIERISTGDDEADEWENLDRLAAEIKARWPDGVSATEAVAEGRV